MGPDERLAAENALYRTVGPAGAARVFATFYGGGMLSEATLQRLTEMLFVFTVQGYNEGLELARDLCRQGVSVTCCEETGVACSCLACRLHYARLEV